MIMGKQNCWLLYAQRVIILNFRNNGILLYNRYRNTKTTGHSIPHSGVFIYRGNIEQKRIK